MDNALLERLRRHRMIAVLRLDSAEEALAAARACIAGGARLIEVTLTVPGALRVIGELAASVPEEVAIGAGTVLSVADLDAARAAGARFAISPDVHGEVIDAARARGILHVPGAFTPTELAAAVRAGAPAVKIFPIASAGGAAHVRLLRGPFPDVALLVTGGVDLPRLGEFLDAGAMAVGLTTTLIEPEAVRKRDWARVEERTRAWVAALAISSTGSPSATPAP